MRGSWQAGEEEQRIPPLKLLCKKKEEKKEAPKNGNEVGPKGLQARKGGGGSQLHHTQEGAYGMEFL
jgi:hypothetical protein